MHQGEVKFQMFEIMIQNSIICFALVLLIFCAQNAISFLKFLTRIRGIITLKAHNKYQVCYIYVLSMIGIWEHDSFSFYLWSVEIFNIFQG